MLDIEKLISNLRSDSNHIEFTGFVTNAHIIDTSLRGEIWHHEKAEPSGRFADGHLIETSRIIDVETRGNSVWFDTESGSRYGVLSFSPMGMIHLASIRDVDGFPFWPPKEKHQYPVRKIKNGGTLKEFVSKRSKVRSPESTSSHPFRPKSDPAQIERYKAQFEETLKSINLNNTKLPELVTKKVGPTGNDYDSAIREFEDTYYSMFIDLNAGDSLRGLGPGWFPLIETFCALLHDNNENPENAKVLIKNLVSKFGSLRIMLSEASPQVRAWIEFAERQSCKTCEICGGPGRIIYEAGWQRTRCENHKYQPTY